MFLSKSNYMQALNCPKALWLTKNRKDLVPEVDPSTQARFDAGNQLQDLARGCFPNGVLVPGEIFDIIGGAKRTREFAEKHDILFEATALLDNGAFCRIDVLRRNGQVWDMIEIKGATRVKEEYLNDLAYQKYVFDAAGYPIQRCFVLHVNSDYIRQGELDIMRLFALEEVTEGVLEHGPNVPFYIEQFLKSQSQKDEPTVSLKSACRDCPFFGYCGKDVPAYSIFNLLRAPEADVFYARTGSFNIADVPVSLCSTPKQLIDREAFLTGTEHCEPASIKMWLDTLTYPLYYLDFETLQSPVPLFDGSWAYAQIPFQFSLHIQDEQNGAVRHIGFLHQERTDPRRALAESLVASCGKSGSVIAYNAMFEKGRIAELAELFPDLSDALLAINERMVDQLIPFRNRYLYRPKQQSSASIKYVLPAFSDLSYAGMEISNGGEAMSRYLDFMLGKLSPEEEKILFDGLDKYCGQDTYAMVVLMAELYKRSV